MLKKVIAIAASVFILTSVFTGCGTNKTSKATDDKSTTDQTKAGKVKLSFLNGTVEMVDYWNQYFDKYNSSNKDGITVEHQYQKEATKALQVRMAAGDTPDLIGCDPTQDMIDNKKFVDLTDSPWWSSLNPSVKAFSTDVKSGKTYAIATLQGAVGIYYNKAIFNELGLKPANTWKEFVSNLQTIKQKKPDVVPFYMGGKDGWMLQHLAEFTFQAPAKQKLNYTDQQKAMQGNDLAKLGWDNTPNGALATVAGYLMDLQKEGLINSNIVTATYDNQTTEFASGKAAVISQGLWAAGDIQKKNADIKNFGFSQYPAVMDGTKPVIGSTVDGKFYISAESKNVEAVKKVLDGILQPDNMKALSEARKSPSANPSVKSDWGYLQNDVGNLLKDTNIASVTFSAMPAGFSGDDEGRLFQELFAGKYKQSTDFAKAWVDSWNKGFNQK